LFASIPEPNSGLKGAPRDRTATGPCSEHEIIQIFASRERRKINCGPIRRFTRTRACITSEFRRSGLLAIKGPAFLHSYTPVSKRRSAQGTACQPSRSPRQTLCSDPLMGIGSSQHASMWRPAPRQRPEACSTGRASLTGRDRSVVSRSLHRNIAGLDTLHAPIWTSQIRERWAVPRITGQKLMRPHTHDAAIGNNQKPAAGRHA